MHKTDEMNHPLEVPAPLLLHCLQRESLNDVFILDTTFRKLILLERVNSQYARHQIGSCYNQGSFLILQYKIALKNLPQYPLQLEPGEVYVTVCSVFPIIRRLYTCQYSNEENGRKPTCP